MIIFVLIALLFIAVGLASIIRDRRSQHPDDKWYAEVFPDNDLWSD